jgi:hypothetical protein
MGNRPAAAPALARAAACIRCRDSAPRDAAMARIEAGAARSTRGRVAASAVARPAGSGRARVELAAWGGDASPIRRRLAAGVGALARGIALDRRTGSARARAGAPQPRVLLRHERAGSRARPALARAPRPGGAAHVPLPGGPARLSLLDEVAGLLTGRGIDVAVIGAAALAGPTGSPAPRRISTCSPSIRRSWTRKSGRIFARLGTRSRSGAGTPRIPSRVSSASLARETRAST